MTVEGWVIVGAAFFAVVTFITWPRKPEPPPEFDETRAQRVEDEE